MNYGIGMCERNLAVLRKAESEMFKTHGHGFDCLGDEYRAELTYKRWLKKWRKEKQEGLRPSYDPAVHGD